MNNSGEFNVTFEREREEFFNPSFGNVTEIQIPGPPGPVGPQGPAGNDGKVKITYNEDTGEMIIASDSSGNTSTNNKCQSGLKVAVIGDSISTQINKNACEVKVGEGDVGVTLSSYITAEDEGKKISLDGIDSNYTIMESDVGKQLTFKPCASDIGKTLGTPKNYNKFADVWWQVAANELGFEPIAACWSGSSITSHTAKESGKEASYAWHDHTIRKLGKRIEGSMQRIAPDVVLIYRGTNDLSHSKKVRLTEGYFDKANWNYPTTDKLTSDSFGYKEGLSITIQKIRETYPKAQIVLCTCNVFKRSSYSHFPTHNGVFSIPQMNNAIREVADFFGCHTIEFDKCGITWENCYDEGYITDSSTKPTHPNATGHKMMARQAISDLLNKLHIYDIVPAEDIVDAIDTPVIEGDIPEQEGIQVTGTLVEGVYVNKATGAFPESAKYFTIKDIPVVENAEYSTPYARNAAFYDADGIFISSFAGSGYTSQKHLTPTDAVTMAICYKYIDLQPSDVVVLQLSESKPVEVVQGTLVDNYFISNDGVLTAYTGSETKYFIYADIPVEPSVTYNAPYARNVAFYDGEGNYISMVSAGGTSSAKLTTPNNATTMTVTYQYKNFESTDDVIITKA